VRTTLDVLLAIVGSLLVVSTLSGAVRSTVLPRRTQVWTTGRLFVVLRVIFKVVVGRSASYERRDRIMAVYGPVTLLGLLTIWMIQLMIGFTMIFWGISTRSFGEAVEISGASLFTLGTAAPRHLPAQLVTYLAAGMGLLVLTLLITYLPSIYAAFSRREQSVALLTVRAGNPPTATGMLVRFHLIDNPEFRLNELWQNWEAWFVDIEESHASFPVLALFRSPQPGRSWVTAAGTVLDAASMWVSTMAHPDHTDADAQLCIRAGYLCLRQIANGFGVPHDENPQPGDPITISRYEYDEACEALRGVGVELVHDLDAAWASFAGWRVNYDTVLLNLARLTEAPIAPWTSDRSPVDRSRIWSLRLQVAPRTVNAAARAKRRHQERRG
jgi:hypothetical protein